MESKPVTDTNSIKHTLKVALILCLCCSVLVSVFAVGLKGWQDDNKKQFMNLNVLKAAGLIGQEDSPGSDEINELFATHVTQRILDFEEGAIVGDAEEAAKFDPKKTEKDPQASIKIEDDIAKIRRRENRTVVYEIRDTSDGPVTKLVLRVRGYGLWSTLRGFIALDISDAANGPDGIQIAGLTYYDHKETPGLGGEVDNPRWKAKWPGKKAFDADWNVKIEVAKGASGIYQVDAISGATITSRGVSNMLAYWLGDDAFGPWLETRPWETSKTVEPAKQAAAGDNAKEESHGKS